MTMIQSQGRKTDDFRNQNFFEHRHQLLPQLRQKCDRENDA